MAGDDGGNVLITHAPRKGPSSWSVRAVDPGHTVTRVLCPTVSVCLATDDAGAVFTSSKPSGAGAMWVRTPVDPRRGGSLDLTCTTGERRGDSGSALRRTITCFAFDHARRVFVATNPGGGSGAWTSAGATPRRVHGMSCPTAKLCVGFDPRSHLIWSRRPAGGARTWKRSRGPFAGRPPNDADSWAGPLGLSCPSVALCVATDVTSDGTSYVRVSTSPTRPRTRWKTVETTPSELTAAFCSAPTLCLAVGQSGHSAVSTDPTRSESWHKASIDRNGAVTAVGCPSTSFCVATDRAGNVILGSRAGGARQTQER
jgi:hypothetical protein